ncbi:MAG TPA: multiheme c-type cytochrome, partial [Vicinamibacterales bacterium]|nr:multiheme c-type cytochrome [Vicinamibacterales bacterium]
MKTLRSTRSWWVPLLLSAYALNTAYLAATASPTIFYYGNVVLHIVGGVGLVVAWLRGRGPKSGVSWQGLKTLPYTIGYMLLASGIAFGLLITVVGAAGRWRWLLPVHIALSLAGGVPLAIAGALSILRRGAPGERAPVATACAIAVIAAIAAPVAATMTSPRAKNTNIIRNPSIVPASMNEEGAGPSSPFFPSSGDTNVHRTIPANFFMTSDSCGRCHTDIYEQWKSSTHHFSSFNNQWYRKSIEYMQDTVGTKPSKWCAGCHDHAVFFNGRFDRPIKEQIDTPEAQAGLACTSCHSITHVRSTMGQGDFEIEYPPLHDLAASNHAVLRFVHDQLTYIDPKPHKDIFLKPFHREQTPEFCSSCHKVHLDVPVNSYRWFRGFNDYDNWQASGVSGQGARSFYYPPKTSSCSDCHMPLVESRDPGNRDGKV